jgi:hypothetical protein
MRGAIRWAAIALALFLAGTRAAGAQFAAPSAVIRTTPATPARGSVVWLLVEDDWARNDQPPLTEVEGEVAGEPLHFEPAERGFVALLGVPLEGGDTLPVALRLSRTGRVDSMALHLAVRHPSYPRERLRVPPRMIQYDSVTRTRIQGEQARALEVSRRSHESPRLWSVPLVLPRNSRITSPSGGAR